jgi:hypothetical protein
VGTPDPDAHWTLYVTIDPLTRTHFLWDESTVLVELRPGETHRRSTARTSTRRSARPRRAGSITNGSCSPTERSCGEASRAPDSSTEALVELPPGAKESNVIWTCGDGLAGLGWWCESNGLFYNPETDSYIYSFYTNSSVVEVDRKTGRASGGPAPSRAATTSIPRARSSRGSTACRSRRTATLLLSTKKYADDPKAAPDDGGAEYAIDHATRHAVAGLALRLRCVRDDERRRVAPPERQTRSTSSARAGQIEEYLPDCTVVWHLDFGSNYLLGRGEFVEDLYTLLSPH